MIKREFARHLRQNPSDAEGSLWTLLSNRRLNGFKFRRQVPIRPFVADIM